MTAKDIYKALDAHYHNTEFNALNIYFFNNRYGETDFLVCQKNGYCFDIEVKCSKGDYKADFKKEYKHDVLSGRILGEKPNRFYYAVPENLIKTEDVPSYAGLLHITEFGTVRIMKQAPFLHKEKIPYYERLCKKFYWGYRELKRYLELDGVDVLKRELGRAQKESEQRRKETVDLRRDLQMTAFELRHLQRTCGEKD